MTKHNYQLSFISLKLWERLYWLNFFPQQFSCHKNRRENYLDHTFAFTVSPFQRDGLQFHFLWKADDIFLWSVTQSALTDAAETLEPNSFFSRGEVLSRLHNRIYVKVEADIGESYKIT